MSRRTPILAGIGASLLALWLLSRITPAGYTRIDLAEGEGAGGRVLLSAIVSDGERVTLTWRNSQFGLRVTESFHGRSGVLVQDRVTFAQPDGTPPPRVSPLDVDDLFHTGGAFDAQGLSRPFRRIVYRIGEIGDPKLHLRGRTVALKQAAGFGGRVVLTAARPTAGEILLHRAQAFFPFPFTILNTGLFSPRSSDGGLRLSPAASQASASASFSLLKSFSFPSRSSITFNAASDKASFISGSSGSFFTASDRQFRAEIPSSSSWRKWMPALKYTMELSSGGSMPE